MRSQLAILALSALSVVSAQNFTINPDEVDPATRVSWCSGESTVCDTLCEKQWLANDCDSTTLSYNCTCSNGSAPGLQYYKQSMPAFICNQAYADCNEEHVGDAAAQRNCTTSIQDTCGTLDIANFTATPTTTSSAGSSSATGSGSAASSGASAAATSSSTAAAAPTNIHLIGNGAAVAAVGLFAYLL